MWSDRSIQANLLVVKRRANVRCGIFCSHCTHALQTPRVDIYHPLNSNEAHSIALSYPEGDFGAESESEDSFSGGSSDDEVRWRLNPWLCIDNCDH